MFEEVEARAYKNLRGDIKAIINDMIEKMRIENVKVRECADKKWFTEAEYHAGYIDAVCDTLVRVMNIIDTIDSEVSEQIYEEDRKFAEEMFADEISPDSSRSKQL